MFSKSSNVILNLFQDLTNNTMQLTKDDNCRYGWVYILMNNVRSTLCVYVNKDLLRWISEYRKGLNEGFSQKHNLYNLVYYERFHGPCLANRREKQLKRWHRDWKLNLVKKVNSELRDLLGEFRKEVRS